MERFGSKSLGVLRKKYALNKEKNDIQLEIYAFLIEKGFNFSEIGKVAKKTHGAIRSAIKKGKKEIPAALPESGVEEEEEPFNDRMLSLDRDSKPLMVEERRIFQKKQEKDLLDFSESNFQPKNEENGAVKKEERASEFLPNKEKNTKKKSLYDAIFGRLKVIENFSYATAIMMVG